MEFEHVRSTSSVLSETNIDFYGEPDVQFHFNSGRTSESETYEEEQDDGSTVTKTEVDTTPCPHVDVYNNGDSLDVLIHLPMGDPIVIDHLRVMDDYEAFFTEVVQMLEAGYNGIDEVTEFTDDSGGSLGTMVRTALGEGTPSEVSVPVPA